MPANLTLLQWGAIIFGVSQTIPIGISYRELQGVAFYDLSYPLDYLRKDGGYGRKIKGWNGILHHIFFEGFLSSVIFAAMFLGWFYYAFYQPESDMRDTIMALMTFFFGLMTALPWVFIQTDPGYYTRIEWTLKYMMMTKEERKKVDEARTRAEEEEKRQDKKKPNRKSNASDEEEDDDDDEQTTDPPYDRELELSKRNYFWSRRLLIGYSFLIFFTALTIMFMLIFVDGIRGWERKLSISMYALCAFLSIFIIVLFFGMRNPFQK